jgi:hypothetical protein
VGADALGLAGAKGNTGILIRTASCRARAAEKYRRQRIELRPECRQSLGPIDQAAGAQFDSVPSGPDRQ